MTPTPERLTETCNMLCLHRPQHLTFELWDAKIAELRDAALASLTPQAGLAEGWTLAAKYILGACFQIEGGCSAIEAEGIVRRVREGLSKAMLEPETMEHGLSLAAHKASQKGGGTIK